MITILILVTVCVLTVTVATETYHNSRQALFSSAKQLGETLATTLEPAIRTGSLWQAYTTITAPLTAQEAGTFKPDIVVIDHQNRIFVSSNPDLYPTFAEIGELAGLYSKQLSSLDRDNSSLTLTQESEETNQFYVVSPVISNGIGLGFILMIYSRDVLLPSVYSIVRNILLWTAVILLVLLPVGWYVGRQIVSPLTHLASCMEKLPDTSPSEIIFNPSNSSDEIGLLGRQFKLMLNELSQKKDIERQIVAEDRLAAIGRMTAGIAHEINNPLGGMLNSINTFKHHRDDPRIIENTFSLIERGLLQIKETVTALLVEARVETHPFSPNDIEDVRTLMEPGINEKSGTLNWYSNVAQDLPLPSTQIRQILINLLLNAINGIDSHGHVTCDIRQTEGSLNVKITNDGSEIPDGNLEHLFEPFYSEADNGVGIGLWVTYQIIQQLDGEINVENQPNNVCFRFTLPMPI